MAEEICKQQWMEKDELENTVMEGGVEGGGEKAIFHMPFNGLRATE